MASPSSGVSPPLSGQLRKQHHVEARDGHVERAGDDLRTVGQVADEHARLGLAVAVAQIAFWLQLLPGVHQGGVERLASAGGVAQRRRQPSRGGAHGHEAAKRARRDAHERDLLLGHDLQPLLRVEVAAGDDDRMPHRDRGEADGVQTVRPPRIGTAEHDVVVAEIADVLHEGPQSEDGAVADRAPLGQPGGAAGEHDRRRIGRLGMHRREGPRLLLERRPEVHIARPQLCARRVRPHRRLVLELLRRRGPRVTLGRIDDHRLQIAGPRAMHQPVGAETDEHRHVDHPRAPRRQRRHVRLGLLRQDAADPVAALEPGGRERLGQLARGVAQPGVGPPVAPAVLGAKDDRRPLRIVRPAVHRFVRAVEPGHRRIGGGRFHRVPQGSGGGHVGEFRKRLQALHFPTRIGAPGTDQGAYPRHAASISPFRSSRGIAEVPGCSPARAASCRCPVVDRPRSACRMRRSPPKRGDFSRKKRSKSPAEPRRPPLAWSHG